MRNFLENTKTLIGELIGLVGGFVWAKNTNWDYEPIILMTISAVGIIIFIALRFIPTHDDRPIVELEFVHRGGFRSPPDIIANLSPKDETGQYFVIEVGGTYLFKVGQRFQLVIRNNSKNNAYNLTLYRAKDSYPLIYKSKPNSLEPLIIDNPKIIELTYEVFRPMTHMDAEAIKDADVPDDLKNLIFVAQYQSESRKTYYTKFSPLNINEHFLKFPNPSHFEKI